MNEHPALLAWDVEIQHLAKMREDLKSRAEFPVAAQRLATNMILDCQQDPSLDSLLKDAGRTVAALSAVCLDASDEITLEKLRRSLSGFSLVSRGRVRSLLAHLLYLGCIEICPGSTHTSRRPRVYRLTERFRETYRRHEISILDALQIVEPSAKTLIDNLGNRQVFDALVIEQGEAFRRGSPQASPYSLLYSVFMHRLAGIQIIHALVAEAETFPPVGPISLSAAAVGKRFRVSRAHVTRMIDAAVAHGFMEDREDSLWFTEAGREALVWLYASRLAVHLSCAARALRVVSEVVRSAA